jgi:uncharacterized membrane protein YgcG
VVGQEPQKPVLRVLLGVRGHKGAAPLAAHHQVFSGQLVNGFAHRALAHPKTRGQVHLAGNQVTRLPFTGLQALQNQALDLLVKRAEGGCGQRVQAGLGNGQGFRSGGGQSGHVVGTKVPKVTKVPRGRSNLGAC